LVRNASRKRGEARKFVFNEPELRSFNFINPTQTHQWLRKEWPERFPEGERSEEVVLRVLKVAEARLNELRAASLRPHSQLVLPGDGARRFKSDEELESTDIVKIRQLVEVVGASMYANVLAGNPDVAVQDLRVCLKVSSLAKSDLGLVGAMIGVFAAGIAVDPLNGHRIDERWTDAHLDEIQAMFAEVDVCGQVMTTVAQFEMAVVNRVMEEGGQFWLRIYCNREIVAERSIFWPRGWRRQNQLHYSRCVLDYWMALRDSQTGRIDLDLINSTKLRVRSNGKLSHPFHWLSAFAFHDYSRAIESAVKRQTECDQVVLHCALERHRRRHGDYPRALEELDLEILRVRPRDRISGEEYGYRVTEQGEIKLHSVGWDGRDQGGQGELVSDGSRYVSQDWIWPSKPRLKR
jgi:hypothetical protein